jgi:hypothetical protein
MILRDLFCGELWIAAKKKGESTALFLATGTFKNGCSAAQIAPL